MAIFSEFYFTSCCRRCQLPVPESSGLTLPTLVAEQPEAYTFVFYPLTGGCFHKLSPIHAAHLRCSYSMPEHYHQIINLCRPCPPRLPQRRSPRRRGSDRTKMGWRPPPSPPPKAQRMTWAAVAAAARAVGTAIAMTAMGGRTALRLQRCAARRGAVVNTKVEWVSLAAMFWRRRPGAGATQRPSPPAMR